MSVVKLSAPMLIVEDDRNTASLIATYLLREGFATEIVLDGALGGQIAAESAAGETRIRVQFLA